jgi:hypothetical protein
MSFVHTALDALAVLTERYAFAEVAALLAAGAGGERLSAHEVASLQQLCAFGQRLLDLDAEDFGRPDAISGSNIEHAVADRVRGEVVPSKLLERSLECRMPQSPREKPRGALGSLRPAYRLMLEVVRARFARRETANVVATVHIVSEYAPLLVWERALGHAGDPVLLPRDVDGEGSMWGEFDLRECPHTKTEKSAAKRALTVARGNSAGWQSYLDRQHSIVAHALAICAASCRRRCTVYTRLSPQERATVTAGSRIAVALGRIRDRSIASQRAGRPRLRCAVADRTARGMGSHAALADALRANARGRRRIPVARLHRARLGTGRGADGARHPARRHGERDQGAAGSRRDRAGVICQSRNRSARRSSCVDCPVWTALTIALRGVCAESMNSTTSTS